jgi:aryl-alcohol dehydrogenase-like predicted oxidoreductase
MERRSLVEAAISAGINLVDTSPLYGPAEKVLSAALRGRREQVQVATKV